jgi:hypothetical protein
MSNVSRREALKMTAATGLAALGGTAFAEDDKPKKYTVITKGTRNTLTPNAAKDLTSGMKEDKAKEFAEATIISVVFEARPATDRKLAGAPADESKSDSKPAKFQLKDNEKLHTNGAIVESKGDDGSTVLEVIGIEEFRTRFPDIVKANPKLARASGFCSLMGPPYYCAKSTCTGSCTLHNIPVYCSCG